jgi:Bacterial membrane protein YfhO
MTAAPRGRADPAARAHERSGAARALWPHGLFLLLAVAFCAPALAPGRVLMPTNPNYYRPWLDEGDVAERLPSNGLMGDSLIFTLPGRVWNHRGLSRGRIPLWNPHVFAGYPHLALIQNNALYPLSAPFDAIDPLAGLALSALLHFALAGSLMCLFLRRVGLEPGAAAIGGAAFELNGMFLVRVSAPSYVYSGIWLPLLLLGAHAIATATGPRRRIDLAVVAATALSVLGGHPQITSLALLLAGSFLVVEAWALGGARGHASSVLRATIPFATSVALGVGLAGFQVVPFLELMANSARESMSLEAYRAAALPLAGMLQALVPDVFGNPVDRNYWLAKSAELLDGVAPEGRFWAVNYSGGNVYTGIAPLVLAALAVLRSPRRRATLFFALAAVASLGVLLGSPLLDLAYLAVPGFRYSRPDRVLYLYMGSLAVLSALGFEALARGDGAPAGRARAWQVWAVTALALVAITWRALPRLLDRPARRQLLEWLALAWGHWGERAATLVPQALFQLGTLLACLAAVAVAARSSTRRGPIAVAVWLILLAAPNLLFGWHFNPAQRSPHFGTTDVERLLVEQAAGGRVARILVAVPQFLPANVSQIIGLLDVHGASAAGVGAYLGLIDAADPDAVAKQKYFRSFDDPAVARGHLLDVLGARLIVSDEDLSDVYEPIASAGPVQVYRNPHALPRFRVVGAYDLVETDEDAREHLLAAGFDPRERVLLTRPRGQPPLPPLPPSLEGLPAAEVVVERDEPEDIVLRVAAPRGGILVASDVDYPGWEARVDGEQVPIMRANAAFRGIALPAGAQVVELSFRPRSLVLGAGVSAGSLVLIVLLCLGGAGAPGGRLRGRRGAGRPPAPAAPAAGAGGGP